MTKHATNNRGNEPEQTNAIADVGEASEQNDEAPPSPSGEQGHPQRHGKPVKIDSAELEALKTKAAHADDYYDQLLRARADFDNYRKRVTQEKQYAELAANEKLLHSLLGILDTFERALASAEKADGVKAILDGVKLVQSQLQNVLKETGVEEIDALNKKFDPNFHEAVQQVVSNEHEEGTVVQQIRKGYKFKDRLLRPATVIVSKPAEESSPVPKGTK